MVDGTTRMFQLGVVADARLDPGLVSALPKLAHGAGLDAIWCTDGPPTGPLPPVLADRLKASAGELAITVRDDAEVVRWRGGAVPDIPGSMVLIPAWPRRALPGLLARWAAESGSLERIVVEVPVSIGRTQAEAGARVTDWFADLGWPGEHGLFGTLEDCQDQAAALASLGVGALRCVLPGVDLPDVIAQLSAVGVGTRATHGPAKPRSPFPPPPAGWGGPRRVSTGPTTLPQVEQA
jgi:hypothetical protein